MMLTRRFEALCDSFNTLVVDSLIGKCLHFLFNFHAARRVQLGHDDLDHLLFWIDPEIGVEETAPVALGRDRRL